MEGEKEGRREDDVCLLLDQSSPSCPSHLAGGKGHNLWVLGSMEGCTVPDWFCITTNAFAAFIEVLHQIIILPLLFTEPKVTTSVYHAFCVIRKTV